MIRKEIAEALRLKPRQIDNLVVDGMPRRRGKGHAWEYGIDAVVWYYDRKIETLETTKTPPLSEARARRELAQAELAEYELAQKKDQTLTVDTHLELLTEYVSRIRGRLLATPGKWAPRMVNLRSVSLAQSRAEDLVDDVLLELTRIGEEIENGDNHDDAPSERKRKPRGSDTPKSTPKGTKRSGKRRARKARASAKTKRK